MIESHLKGRKPQRVPRPPVPSKVYIMPSGSRSRLKAAKLSLPCLCCLSTTLCPRSSGVWLRQAETAVLGAGGRGGSPLCYPNAISADVRRLQQLCNQSDITTDIF